MQVFDLRILALEGPSSQNGANGNDFATVLQGKPLELTELSADDDSIFTMYYQA